MLIHTISVFLRLVMWLPAQGHAACKVQWGKIKKKSQCLFINKFSIFYLHDQWMRSEHISLFSSIWAEINLFQSPTFGLVKSGLNYSTRNTSLFFKQNLLPLIPFTLTSQEHNSTNMQKLSSFKTGT